MPSLIIWYNKILSLFYLPKVFGLSMRKTNMTERLVYRSKLIFPSHWDNLKIKKLVVSPQLVFVLKTFFKILKSNPGSWSSMSLLSLILRLVRSKDLSKCQPQLAFHPSLCWLLSLLFYNVLPSAEVEKSNGAFFWQNKEEIVHIHDLFSAETKRE